MNPNKALESISMDLLRVALGLHRGSKVLVKRFKQEALLRSQELESINFEDHYLKTLMEKTKILLKSSSAKKAEEILMYSILFKNLAQSQYPLH